MTWITSPHDRQGRGRRVPERQPEAIDKALAAASAAADELGSAGRRGTRAACSTAPPTCSRPTGPRLMALLVREAGKTLANAQADLREAVDHLRYAAAQARANSPQPRLLKGPTGEENALSLHGRGVFACISPWNFPLAIFTGQIAGRARRRQRGGGKARGADAAGRGARGQAAASGRRSGRMCCISCRASGETVGAALVEGPAGCRRGLHRRYRHRYRHQPRARRTRRSDRQADRRDRRPERHDRRFLGAAGAGGRRCARFGLRQRRPTLLGAARAVPARGRGRRDAAHADRGRARAQDRRSARLRHRCRAGDRRRGPRRARSPQGTHAQGGARAARPAAERRRMRTGPMSRLRSTRSLRSPC